MSHSASTPEQELEWARKGIDQLKSRLSEVERERLESEAMLKFRDGVIENAAEGVCVCHDIPEFPFVNFTVWNRRMIEITGYTMDEINRHGWYQTMYPDPALQERARARMDRMREGDNLRFERWTIQCANGEKRPIAISTSVLVMEEGSVHVLGLMQDLSQIEALKKEARRAKTDELTAVRNRRGFQEEAELVIEVTRRQRQPVTGHAEGDRALTEIGRELLASVRSLDVVGRLGGDEFALVLPGMGATNARDFFENVTRELSQLSERSGWPIGYRVRPDRPNFVPCEHLFRLTLRQQFAQVDHGSIGA